MNDQTILIGVYVCFVILQMYIVKNYILDWKSLESGINIEQMKYNLTHKAELGELFTKEIESRVKMLKNMEYSDWINYNNKNAVITHNGYEYDLFIYERAVNDPASYLSNTHYTLRANRVVDNLGLSYVDLIRQANYSFIFSLFIPNPDLLETIFLGPQYENQTNIYAYFTVDTKTNRAVKTNAVTGIWKKEVDSENVFEGVILIGYNLIDVEDQYANKYYDYVETSFLVIVSLGTIITSLLLYHSSGQQNIWVALLFLCISNIYILKFLNTTEGVTTLPIEQDRVKDINDGILSISFLAAVNIYILQTLKAVKGYTDLHNESAFLFTLALILLLIALYKKTNYNKIDEIRIHRIIKQFMYNLSIYVNLFILFNYIVYVARDGRVTAAIKKYLIKTLK